MYRGEQSSAVDLLSTDGGHCCLMKGTRKGLWARGRYLELTSLF